MSFVSVIQWEVNTSELVHKSPAQDLTAGSQLVVYPGQTAFFVKGGEIYDEFHAGTHQLNTENIPLLNRVLNLPFGGDTPFQAEVWFVNGISLLDFLWGTSTPIQIEDPIYNVIVPVRAYGQYGFKVSNPRMFLEKISGNMASFDKKTVEAYFRGVILSKLTAIVAQKICQEQWSVLTINTEVEAISNFALSELKNDFDKYGIELELFKVIGISVNEQDPSFIRLKETKSALAHINIMGKENYQMERSLDILEGVANNQGGGMVAATSGIGVGIGLGAQLGNLLQTQLKTGMSGDTPPSLNSGGQQIKYYLGVNGTQSGPFDAEIIKAGITNGQIDSSVMIWKSGMANWLPISQLPEFQTLFSTCPPPLS